MTRRETLLVGVFVSLVVVLIGFVGLGTYWSKLSQLDEQFAVLRQRATQLSQMVARGSVPPNKALPTTDWSNLPDRFWSQEPLPSPLLLAKLVQKMLKTNGLRVLEARVTENKMRNQWVSFQAEGTISQWFLFLDHLRQNDPKTLFRSLSLVRKHDGTYTIEFEVGYAVVS